MGLQAILNSCFDIDSCHMPKLRKNKETMLMSRPGVTYTEVAHIAQHFLAEGIQPTIERIRAKLETGSHTTIGTHLKTWRNQQEGSLALALQTQLPESLVAIMQNLWEDTRKEAERKVINIETQATHQLNAMRDALQEKEAAFLALQQQNQTLEKQRITLLDEKTALENVVIQLQTSNVALETRQAGLLEQLNEKQTQIDAQRKQNQQTQANLEHYRETMREQRLQEQQRADTKQQQLEYANLQLASQLKDAQQHDIQQRQHYQQLLSQYDNLKSSYDEINKKEEMAHAHILQLEKNLAKASIIQEHYEILERQTKKQQQELLASEKLYAGIQQQLLMVQTELEKLQEQNQSLLYDKLKLTEENALVQGQLKHLNTKL